MVAPLTPEDPQTLGEYTLSGRLGEGGQGIVYLGESPDGSRVAVKVLKGGFDPAVRQRLARELTAMRGVASFCTARVITAEVEGREPYVVSEFIDGPSLHDRVTASGPLRGGELERLAVGTATALTAIHGAGIVHRDFKPGNVLLGPDGPRVVDFGIARQSESATITAGPIGTPAYLSPEQIAGQPAAPASDVFAWGATMVFAATGRPAFGADSVAAVLHRIMTLTPDLGGVPEPLQSTVRRCLDKDPAARPTSRDLLLTLVGSTPDPLTTGAAAASHPSPPPHSYPPTPAPQSWPGQQPAPGSWPGQNPMVASQPGQNPAYGSLPGSAPNSWPGQNQSGAQPWGTHPGQEWRQQPHATSPAGSGGSGNRGRIIALVAALVAILGTAVIVVPRLIGGPEGSNSSTSSTTDPSEEPTEDQSSEEPTEESTEPTEESTDEATEEPTDDSTTEPATDDPVIPDAYAGTWAGHIVPEPQGIMSEHDIRIELPSGEPTGQWYEDGCTGTLTVEKAESESLQLRLHDSGACVPGTVILTPKDDQLAYQWNDAAGLVTYTGDLTKED
ncbi:hypothetical protein Aph01nite_67520 [Acrocarpospora phusangensis]|uniref:Protein kinase domain-containing protein n=1 Tax=Acrocarpospora phusangensis TaxID=1070424 RepID=A0A919URU7_9ACTN|nr:serine/threonine-protein kinase [Acrocarpospora phusangensis]GIH28442.1 hypothetical protein Aph01nite_67520 [Acrocarpospora phusangensis]